MTFQFSWHLMELPMEFPFGISRSIKTVARTVRVELTYLHRGETLLALGEAVPSSFYGETYQTVMAFYDRLVQEQALEGLNPLDLPELEQRLAQYPENMAAKAGLEIAFHDLVGKIRQQPLYTFWRLEPTPLPKTSYTIGIADTETVRHKTKIALERGYDVLKIKLGGPDDLEILRLIRAMAPKATLRVDANAGWTLDEALSISDKLYELGIEFIEAPLQLASPDSDYIRLKSEGAVPIMADENCHTLKDVPRCADLFHAINLKHTKTGGLAEAKRMIYAAREHGLKVMLGGFAETSISVTAFAHLAPLVDYADLDACLLIANDPYEGLLFKGSEITLPDRPGIGVISRFNPH